MEALGLSIEGLGIVGNTIIVVLSIVALWKGADFVVESAAKIGKDFGMTDLIIGLTIVAFGTSAPEFAVTIVAALNGQGDISVGNVVGSNIFNLGFVLGGVVAVRAIPTTKTLVYRDGVLLIVVTIMLYFFIAFDFRMQLYEGVIFFGSLMAYLAYLFFRGETLEDEEIEDEPATAMDWVLLVTGLVLVVAGGDFLVESASFIAREAGVSEWVIAVTIVAAGTSAPEVATSLIAVLRGKYGISVGNLIGSDLFNLLGVLGVAAMINPGMQVDPFAQTSVALLIGMVVITVIFMRTGWKLERWEGVVLFLIGLSRWIFDFMYGPQPPGV